MPEGLIRPSADPAELVRRARVEHIPPQTLLKIAEKLVEMEIESRRTVQEHLHHDVTHDQGSKDVGDDVDHASDEREREFSLLMHQRHLDRLEQIEAAYERFEDGTYGLCEGTEEPINPRRLLILPLARYSIEYQQHQERLRGRETSFDSGDIDLGKD